MHKKLNDIKDIGTAAHSVLNTPCADDKAALALAIYPLWQADQLRHAFLTPPPKTNARPDRPQLIPPQNVPQRRIGKDLDGRIASLHAFAHIELNAIDLAFDIVCRFGQNMPQEFCDDWLKVGADEAKHFNLLQQRLSQMGAKYGDLPAHGGLWEAAKNTENDLFARLAIVPMVLEARGLDVTPKMIDLFKKAADLESASILEIIYNDEISHVGYGVKWFEYICMKSGKNPNDYFNLMVETYHKKQLKPPFNHVGRSKALMDKSYYDNAKTHG